MEGENESAHVQDAWEGELNGHLTLTLTLTRTLTPISHLSGAGYHIEGFSGAVAACTLPKHLPIPIRIERRALDTDTRVVLGVKGPFGSRGTPRIRHKTAARLPHTVGVSRRESWGEGEG